ncbi:MAG TPA: carbohydrate kinase family protein [Bacteroidales bacterium]|nr:carbohydrate kinase family protein [Bacteroidales bacterium]
MPGKIIVSGTGCCLVDLLYNDINFKSAEISPYLSKKRGDGGLTPGQLVFQEEFENYCGSTLTKVLDKITGGRTHDKINIGGPSIVSLINVSQLVDKEQCEVRFYGRGGNDDIGQYLISALRKTPVVLRDYKLINNRTPSTVVLSDPSYDNGHGERAFLNSIGAAWDYRPDELGDDFFDSDIVVFGGTALVPQIHDHLTTLLKKAKSKGCITIVNTVFDFRNEKANPLQKWPLGESDASYSYIDLLIADQEEAFRLSGEHDPQDAIRFFREKRVSSLIITNGSKNISTYSDGHFFTESGLTEMPVSRKVIGELKNAQGGDTTGCGDNFVGGIIASVVTQLLSGVRHPDLREACCWGVVSGGFTCFYMGGTYFEEETGEKRAKMQPYYEAYKEQIEG